MSGGAIKLLFQIVAIVRWSCGQNSNMITILTNVMSIGITDRHPIFFQLFLHYSIMNTSIVIQAKSLCQFLYETVRYK